MQCLGEESMFRRLVALGLVGLFIVMSFVMAEDSIGPYNPIADVNRDGKVDILDLVEVGQAYGSNYTLMHQTNKTTVTVLSYENNNFAFVENALVAVFPQGGSKDGKWNYTDSSGTITFDLNANSTYIAIGWNNDRESYNYANFTTDSSGEALVVIWLTYYPESSLIRSIPKSWIVITLLDNRTGKPYVPNATVSAHMFAFSFECINFSDEGGSTIVATSSGWYYFGQTFTGIHAWDLSRYVAYPPFPLPNTNVYLMVDPLYFLQYANCTFRTDEYGGSYVVFPIYR